MAETQTYDVSISAVAEVVAANRVRASSPEEAKRKVVEQAKNGDLPWEFAGLLEDSVDPGWRVFSTEVQND